MVLESNRDLVLRRLVECLSRDRTKHQVAEVTSLGLVQMTRKKLGMGLLETFSEACEVCAGRGVVVHHEPHMKARSGGGDQQSQSKGEKSGKQRHKNQNQQQQQPKQEVAKVVTAESAVQINSLVAQIAAASAPTLESLTESLPEPTAAGQGRRKSRRVTSEVQVTPLENE